jgi:DNA-binding transcriptional ArsR family regulator
VLINVIVTPRFEIFYALQALESGTGDTLADWRRDTEKRLPDRLRTSLASIAPTPLVWPLLADALREAPPAVTFDGMIGALRSMDDRSFQTFVLGGVFKSAGAVESLVDGKVSLARTVATEAETQQKLLALLGLHPFSRQNPTPMAFDRIVNKPGSFRDEMVHALESFWTAGFSDTWKKLEPQMKERAEEMRASATQQTFPAFAAEHRLPVTIENETVVSTRGAKHTPVSGSATVYLLPSAFNTSRVWAAYADSKGRTRFFLPVVLPGLSTAGAAPIDPALIFRALGDTTRYAIASSIARNPMTSVELARAFGVSKPTISHHVQLLRSAGLIDETPTESGVLLSLNRRVLERASTAAAREMFAEVELAPIVKRSRRANRPTNPDLDETEK